MGLLPLVFYPQILSLMVCPTSWIESGNISKIMILCTTIINTETVISILTLWTQYF